MKSSPDRRAIEVWADWAGLPEAMLMGTLFAEPVRRREIFAFEYDSDFLESGLGAELDPRLRLFTGPQYPEASQENFGLFLDSCPDRWGRFLMDRREAQSAREEGRASRPLRASDYLLGVHDVQRSGALRFCMPGGPFLDDDRDSASPPWTSLRELEEASLALERQGAENRAGYRKWIRMLVAPGGSLGGARPKAGVMDPRGGLWIAKFPSVEDPLDKGLWEYLVYSLAKKAGVEMSAAERRTFNSRHHTYLTRRFDRDEAGNRRHFCSAMTALNRQDGDDHTRGASYLELAQFLARSGARPSQDLEQLWRRIVFSMCVSNVDDHLRNHGFLLTERGWVLSPAYDVNADPQGDGLKLNVSELENEQDLDLAMEVSPFFRLKPKRAKEVHAEVLQAVRQWRKVASSLRISRPETERMAPAFRLADGS